MQRGMSEREEPVKSLEDEGSVWDWDTCICYELARF